jgi:hypothetical protein
MAVAALCTVGTMAAGCGGNSGPKVSGRADSVPLTAPANATAPTTPVTTQPGGHSVTSAHPSASDLASVSDELNAMSRDLNDAGAAVDGADVDTAKRQEGSAP